MIGLHGRKDRPSLKGLVGIIIAQGGSGVKKAQTRPGKGMDPDLQVGPWIVTFARAMAVLRWRYCLPPHPVGMGEADIQIYG